MLIEITKGDCRIFKRIIKAIEDHKGDNKVFEKG